MLTNMRIVFIGGVKMGLTVLEAVCEAGGEVAAVYALPPEAGTDTSGYVDFRPWAKARGLTVTLTRDVNAPEHVAAIRALAPDLIVVCGWQRLVSAAILESARLGCVGFHSSLLPRYRGRAPVNWAILLGERETGVTLFHLTPHADDGDIIDQAAFPIAFDDDCGSIYEKSARAAAGMIRRRLPEIAAGTAPRLHNPSSTYPVYPKRTPADGRIDFNRSALDVYNFVRALTRPYPGAFYHNESGEKILVWKVEIVFDETRLRPGDIVIPTADLKIRLMDWEKAPAP